MSLLLHTDLSESRVVGGFRLSEASRPPKRAVNIPGFLLVDNDLVSVWREIA